MREIVSDIVVIGAGPAGSTTASLLAKEGYSVTLLDRAKFPRTKPCGDYLTPGAVQILRDDLNLLPKFLESGACSITRETVTAQDGRNFVGHTDAMSCPRAITDQILRNEAECAGAIVYEGFSVREILFDGDRVSGVLGANSENEPVRIRAKVTVGADGTHSMLARALGTVRPIRRLQRIALLTHFSGSAVAPNAAGVSMFLPTDRTRACCGLGPVWEKYSARNINIVVPTSEAKAIAGKRQEYFETRLRQSFPLAWDLMRGAEQIGPVTTVGCFGHATRQAAHNGALLVGDAATFVDPFTGEGVFFALRGAQLAAEAIDRAMRRCDTSYANLISYDAARKHELLPRYRLCDIVQQVVHSPVLMTWATERLSRSPALTDKILQAVGDVQTPGSLLTMETLKLFIGSLSREQQLSQLDLKRIHNLSS